MIGATQTLVLFLASMVVPVAAIAAATPRQLCEKAASDSLRSCVKKVGVMHRKCYDKTGSACAASDPKLLDTLARVGTKVLPKCPDQATVQAAAYGLLKA